MSERDQFLSPARVVELLGGDDHQLSERTLGEWRRKKIGPPVYRFGKHCRYRASEVLAWAESRRAS